MARKQTITRLQRQQQLEELANVPRLQDPESLVRAKRFIARNGPLRAGIKDPSSVLWIACMFQGAWKAKADTGAIGLFLEDIFRATAINKFYGEPGAFPMELISPRGKISLQPRDLLDALAMEFVASRKMLANCARPDCGRYFIKSHARQKFCSTICSEEHLRTYQANWERQRREKGRKGHAKRSNR